jgi:3D (Asp-Asp-Asp) domain-containing protein
MRNIRLVVILLAVIMIIFPKMILASETINTDTNTNNLFSSQFAFLTASIDEKYVSPIERIISATAENKKEKVKSVEEIKNDAILSKWKEKQVDKWKTLPKKPFIINASAYTASADECGNNKGITASGIKVAENRTIACPPEFPFGAKMKIENMGIFVCEDRGGAIKGNHIDIYMLTKAEAFQFGRKNLTAEIVAG